MIAHLAVAAVLALAPSSVTEPKGHDWDGTTTIHAGHRLILSQHRVVVASRLPHCREEDGSGKSHLPCSWNIGKRQDGDGNGLAYWIGKGHRAHYVWAANPTGPRLHWVGPQLADALAEGQHQEHWSWCVTNGRHHRVIRVTCPDGWVSKA